MAQTPGLLSEKTTKNKKISAQFADEFKTLLLAFCLLTLGLEIVLIADGGRHELPGVVFPFVVMGFFLFYCILEYVFNMFVGRKIAAILSVLPATLMFFLLKESDLWPHLKCAILIAAGIRILLVSIPYKKTIVTYMCFVLDAAVLYLWYLIGRFQGGNLTDKFLFVALVLLTLSAVQKTFPFHYFAILGLIVMLIPMSRNPIDWTLFARMGERIAEKAETISYYLPFDNDQYTVGYSSFHVTGEKISENTPRVQIILESADKPYYTFEDEENGVTMRMRRKLYLAGGRGVDKAQIVNFVKFLCANDVNRDDAEIFSQLSKLKIKYLYIDTCDEIAPLDTLTMESNGKKVQGGVHSSSHRKGYTIDINFLDIDYGSPYLTELMEKADDVPDAADDAPLTYDEADDYMKKVYSFSLDKIMSRDEYEEAVAQTPESDSLDTTGSSEKLTALASEITEGIDNDYDKCRAIEEYLRQYPYTKDAVGGYNPDSDMSTAAGMADIAERFLFDSQKGYCVHYTSSMVMLLRACGIPARAQMGYYYTFPFEQQDNYQVTSGCAHTWPEAYIENVGWVPFEPTGAYYTFSDYSWHRASSGNSGEGSSYANGKIPNLSGYVDVTQGNADTENRSNKVAKEALKLALPVAISIAALLFLIIAGSFLVRGIHYHFGTNEEKLRIDVDQIKKGISKRSETGISDRGLLSDYIEKAPEEIRADLTTVFNAYYRSVYGSDKAAAITPQENELARTVRNALRKRVRK